MPAASEPIWDAAVVGAGPGGAVCAAELARCGLAVVMLDRLPPPRYKTCGGGLIWRARRQLDIDLGPVVERESRTAELHLADAGLRFEVRRSVPLVTMTLRADLDRLLVASATAAGAELRAPAAVTGLRPEPGRLRLTTGEGDVRARFVVGADGAAGRVGVWAGIPDGRRLIPALESELAVDDRLLERFADVARFDFGPVAAGYAWVFPKRRQLSVGCLSARPGARSLRRDLDAYLRRLGLGQPRARDDHGFVIPVRPRRRPAGGRVLLVGDAAGLADPVTCEGIGNAIESGRRAARAIAAHRDDPAAARRAYLGCLHRSLLPELRAARLLARALYGAPRLRRLAFRALGQPLTEAVAAVMTGEASYRRLLASPRSYLRLAALVAGRGRA